MGIQPIDLSVMYSQANNVSRVATGAQAAQLSESIMQQTTDVQKNLEKNTKVQETTDDKSTNSKVKDREGSGGSGAFAQNKKNGNQSEGTDSSENTAVNSRSSYLGTIIDIVG